MNSIVREVTNELCKRISENYDNICFEYLKAYGITKENFMENLYRIDGSRPRECKYNHYYVDGMYAFSIGQHGDLNFDNCNYKYTYTFDHRIFKEMVGKRLGEHYE